MILQHIAELPRELYRLWVSRGTNCGPIGVEMEDEGLKVAQLSKNERGADLIYGWSEKRPDDIKASSGGWQRWAINVLREVTIGERFCGREVVASMPTSEVFIENIKLPESFGVSDSRDEEFVFSKIKEKLSAEVERQDLMIRNIATEESGTVVIAIERAKIDRHLAIYEEAGLSIKSLVVWPMALVNSYTNFFGRRKSDAKAVVMLICIAEDFTKVVICRHKNLLWAKLIPTGRSHLEKDRTAEKSGDLEDSETLSRMVLELHGCRRNFGSIYKKGQIERLIFLSSDAIEKEVYATIAKQLEMPAQMGDCLGAVRIRDAVISGIDRRGCEENWTGAFGLSLS